jgi:hypothetical protein
MKPQRYVTAIMIHYSRCEDVDFGSHAFLSKKDLKPYRRMAALVTSKNSYPCRGSHHNEQWLALLTTSRGGSE